MELNATRVTWLTAAQFFSTDRVSLGNPLSWILRAYRLFDISFQAILRSLPSPF